ncbi:MAG: hypothetical protein SFX72_06555 [Isosphaeraceae bacterium]|nr:hypothetical protein [Isosphaeraceae bacterium]
MVVAIVGGLVFSLLALSQARRYARVVEGTTNVIMGGLIDRLDPLAPEPSARIDHVSLAEALKRTYDESTQQVAQSSGLSRLIIASLLLADLGNRRRASVEPAEPVDIDAEIARIQDSLVAPPPSTGFSRLPQQPAQAREAWSLARCEMLLGNHPAALARYAEILRDDPPPPVRVLLEREMIRALEALGRRDEADALRGHVERLTRELAETITRSRRSNTGSVRESLPLPITPR